MTYPVQGGPALPVYMTNTELAILPIRLPDALTSGGGVKAGLVDALPAGEAHVGVVGGAITVVGYEYTRAATITAYLVGDVVSNDETTTTLIPFANIARVVGGSGYITKARLITDQSTCVAQLRLWLYQVDNPSNIPGDNSPFTLLYANKSNRIGYIDFPSLTTEQSGSDSASAMDITIRFAFACAAASRNLYGLLETKTAFTPANAQKLYIELTADQN